MKDQGFRQVSARPLLGSHLSIAGGMENALFQAQTYGFDCVQVFVKNQRQWRCPLLTEDQQARFREARGKTAITPVIAHATYLINLAAPDNAIRRRSVEALMVEADRCDALDIPYLVVHPGAALGQSENEAIGSVVRSLNEIQSERPKQRTTILLETTAGQGSSVGHCFEHLAAMIAGVQDKKRVAVCLDTCHLFAAGYDLHTPGGYDAMMSDLDGVLGLDQVKCIHVNDSKRECGSRVDRHEHIGKGKIGKSGFARLVQDKRWAGIPMILETPKGKDARGVDFDRINLRRLKSFLRPR